MTTRQEAIDVAQKQARLARDRREENAMLCAAIEQALAKLDKGAPGWGVAKDILRAALAKAREESA